MDYATLVAPKGTAGSLASWANYGLFPASEVLGDAQALIYTTLRVREMKSDLTAVPVTVNVPNTPLPANFLDPISLRGPTLDRIIYTDENSLLNRRVIDGNGVVGQAPISRYSIFGEKLQFDAAPNVSGNLFMVYFRSPDLLSPENPTNFLTSRYPMLFRTACLAVAADFRKHEADYMRNAQRLTALIDEVNQKDDLHLRGIEVDPDYRRR